MADDEKKRRRREDQAAGARRRRRQRREAQEATRQQLVAVTTGATVASFVLAPRNVVELHIGQLHGYLCALDVATDVTLETKVRLVAMSLPAIARAVESSDIAARLAAVENEIHRRGLRSIS
jgi:hypothetical protein